MKITLICGEDKPASYKRFEELINKAKAKEWNILHIGDDAKDSISRKLLSLDLFYTKLFFVSQNPEKFKVNDFKWLEKNYSNYEVFLLLRTDKDPRSLINKLPKNITIEKFDLPTNIFKFLDLIKPGNSTLIVNELRQLQGSQSTEFLIAMMARHLRDLFWVKTGGEAIIHPSWRVAKLKRQCEGFEQMKIKDFINDLAEYDYYSKIGKDNYKYSLDLLIARHLE